LLGPVLPFEPFNCTLRFDCTNRFEWNDRFSSADDPCRFNWKRAD